MTKYTSVKVNISEGQTEKLQRAIKAGCLATSIRLSHKDLQGNDILAVTNSQAKKLAKAHENSKGITIGMTSKQLKHNTKKEGGFLGLLAGLAARALPVLAKSFTGVRCWRSFRISIIRSTKSDGVESLPQERRMRLPSGNGWPWTILKTVQR